MAARELRGDARRVGLRLGPPASLGGDDDLRVFDLLRRTADVVLVAAGTVRDEEYGPMVLHDADVAWRRAHGMPDHPVFAIVTNSASMDASSGFSPRRRCVRSC